MKNKMFKTGVALLTTAVLFTTSCKKPAASFTADKSTATVGEVVTFKNTSTDGAMVAFDFGDGTTSNSTQGTQTHVYSMPGTYAVNLMVAKKKGKKPSDAAPVTITITGPAADFTASNSSPVGGEVVTFNSTSTNASSFAWDFGDGSATATTANATHAYAMGGSYIVTLTVKDASGAVVSTTMKTVTVGGATGNTANMVKIVGTWKFKSEITTDVRNGVTFTSSSTSGSLYSRAYSKTDYTEMHEFTTSGNILIMDANGNNDNGGYYNLLDATRIEFPMTPATAYNIPEPTYGTYVVTANLLVITYVSTATGLPSYTEYPTGGGNVPHVLGEKQVVTTVFTYEK